MKLLCIEASADPTVIGISDDEKVLVESNLQNRDELPQRVAELIKQAALESSGLHAIAIGIGPGSFTGLRVGLAFAKGLARAAGIPIWPVPSLKVFAANVANEYERVVVCSPARRGQAHLQIFNGSDLSEATPKQVVEYDSISGLLQPGSVLIGPGVSKFTAELSESFKLFLPASESAHIAQVNSLAKIALTIWSDKFAPDSETIVPEYGLEFGK